jgi:hypothetical protein
MKLLHPKNKNSSIDLVCCLKVEKEFEWKCYHKHSR